MDIFEIIKSVIFGIIQGITEWLPISSTGHLILADEFIKFADTGAAFDFSSMYIKVIQLGSILAVGILFFNKLNPFAPSKSGTEKKATWSLWFKVLIATVPAAIIGLLFDDVIDKYLYSPWVVAATLILYGVFFIIVENMNKKQKVTELSQITYKMAFLIGAFQLLALIPGTSRSGATILGAMLIGTSRYIAAEFSFFLAIPMMCGVSLLEFVKYGAQCTATQWGLIAVGFFTAFAVSLLAIKFLMNFVRKHDFKPFGYYRIALGVAVILYFVFK